MLKLSILLLSHFVTLTAFADLKSTNLKGKALGSQSSSTQPAQESIDPQQLQMLREQLRGIAGQTDDPLAQQAMQLLETPSSDPKSLELMMKVIEQSKAKSNERNSILDDVMNE